MSKKRRVRPKQRASKPVILDSFTEEDIEHWSSRSDVAQRYSDFVYFELERQRAVHHDELVSALREAPPHEVSLDDWHRVTDYRWCLAPLSPAGSLKQIGGRFNIGADIDRARNQHFPALYVAENITTAYREFFGGDPNDHSGAMTLADFALRRPGSFTTFRLRGHVENVFDLRDAKHLKSFSQVITGFKLSSNTQTFARRHNIKPRMLLRTPAMLLRWVVAEPKFWRTEPQLLGIPAPNQILGRFIRDAGFEGVLYRSQRGGDDCLAVFPENFLNSASRIEVVGVPPGGATCLVMDKDHPCMDGP